MGTVVVTGARLGIGAATRTRLEGAGHKVIGVGRAGVEVNFDLSTADGRSMVVEQVHERVPVLQGVIANAGIGIPNPDPAQIVSVNFFGAVDVLEGLLPLLVAGSGKAAVVSSAGAAVVPDIPEDLVEAMLDRDEEHARRLADEYGDLSAYAASKFALNRWVRRTSVNSEWAGRGVSLNGVAPGRTRTPMLEQQPGRADEKSPVAVPVNRIAEADEIAALLEVLLSPLADLMIGQIIYVDGGTEALLRGEHWPANWRTR